MGQAIRRRQQNPLTWLASDRRAHPLPLTLAVTTLLLGALAALTAFFPGLHVVSFWAGLAGLLTGAWGQMISATTGERFLLVTGAVAAGFGGLMGLAHGGPFGGLAG